MKKLLLLLLLFCVSTLSYSQETKGYILCGLQKSNHPGGDNSKAEFEDYISMSNSPILLLINDNTTDISVLMDITGSGIENFDFKFYRSYRDGTTTFTNYYSTENNSQFTIETPESGIPRSFILMAATEDYSLFLFNDCNDKDIINYYKKNPDKIESILKLF